MWKKIVYLTLILMIPSCNVKINCPGFPETHLVWMPYLQGEEFSLTDGIDTFQFKVEWVDITKAYTFTGSKLYYLNPPSEESCDRDARCNITGPKHIYSMIQIHGQQHGVLDWTHFLISFSTSNSDSHEDFYFAYGVENNVEKVSSSLPGEEILSSYDNGYKIFSDVLKIENDTLFSNNQIYQIYIAKNIGFIQIKDRFNHKTWSLIE